MKRNSSIGQVMRTLVAPICLATLLVSTPAPSTRAGALTVTNANDAESGSLRQAVMDASSGETIIFDASLADSTITLASEIALTDTEQRLVWTSRLGCLRVTPLRLTQHRQCGKS